MPGRRLTRLLVATVTTAVVLSVSSAFNIDVNNPDVFTGEQKDFFGYKVLQHRSSRSKGIIVTAPLQLNGSGGIFKQVLGPTPERFNFTGSENPPNSTVRHLGLSIAADPSDSHFTACSPSLVHECSGNTYMNSLCYNFSDSFQEVSSFKPMFQECTKKKVDLVFLFDGSRSMTKEEFQENKKFIEKIMNSLKNTSIKFAAAQFAFAIRTVFDFNDYTKGTALEKLWKEPHMDSLTNTHRGLKFVLDNLFENPAAGASADADKVLVIITDGDPSDTNYENIIETYDKKNIDRFVIGVEKEAGMKKYKSFGSDPKEKHVFEIKNYQGLEGILENFQNRIFSIEGTKGIRAGTLTKEMAQSGFSAAFHKDTLVLGSVGSNSWRGSLQEQSHQNDEIWDPEMPMDSYMGYSISVGERNHTRVYMTGAPRFNHTGQVVLFQHEKNKWKLAQRINGDQIGSYFGAELCSLDVNSDGITDFLLVGAPMFFQTREKEGKLYVYNLNDNIQLLEKQSVMAPFRGRFGSTISSLADLNGDGLREVAVGAPLEDDNRGAVYIYHGDVHKGIRSSHSQKISGDLIPVGMRFFGQAIDGRMDLGDDGLPDVVVGSQGAAVVLRSKPVYNITARLSFHPEEINSEEIDCLLSNDVNLPMVTLSACFEMKEATKSRSGTAGFGLDISYSLNVDPLRGTHRGFFIPTNRKSRNLKSNIHVKDTETACFNHSIYMPKCVKDTLSPVKIALNFSQTGRKNSSAILNMDRITQTSVEVPFQKRCRKNDVCIAELEVDFTPLTSELLVTEDNFFNISVTLANSGDDSYNTSLSIHYPPGLSFSRMSFLEGTRPTLHNCRDGEEEEVLDRTVCDVSLPVFRSRMSATFLVSFRLIKDFSWNDTMLMTVAANSDNSNSSRITALSKSFPVQYQIRMAVTVKEESVSYLKFTVEESAPQSLRTSYRINNIGFKDVPVNVTLVFPTRLDYDFEMRNYYVLVQPNITQCSDIFKVENEHHCPAELHCFTMKCDGFLLRNRSAVDFTLAGDVEFRHLRQQAENVAFFQRYSGRRAAVKFRSFIRVDYDQKRYKLAAQEQTQKPGQWNDNDPTMKSTEVQVEMIIPPDQMLIILTGVLPGLFLIIIIAVIMWKCGCFKRKTFEDDQEEETKASLRSSTPPGGSPAPPRGSLTKSEPGNPDKSSEEILLPPADQA
ncbi:integrin alpha-L [Menidia menidia]